MQRSLICKVSFFKNLLMKETKTKLKDLGFTAGHAHLLIVAVAFFAVLTFAQSDLSLRALFANADDEVVMLTYGDVRNTVASEYGNVSTEADASVEEQLALLDRSLDNGQVLGDVIGIGVVPPVEQMLSREHLNSLPVITTTTSLEAIQMYSSFVTGVEAENEVLTLLGDLNSSDQQTLVNSKQRISKMIAQLGQVVVPSELADFHRYKIIYYQTLSEMADGFISNSYDVNFQNTAKVFFSITDKIERTKSEVQSKYNVAL